MTNEEIARFFSDTQAFIQGNPDLRDPQVEGWFRTRQHFRNSSEHAILQIPVGCGKTGLMALLPFEIAQGRVLVIAPNLEIRRGISTAFNVAGSECFWTSTRVLTDVSHGPFTAVLDGQDANTLPPDGSVKNPTIPDSEYPLRINWYGILVDDRGHEDDIVRRVRDVLEVIWKDRAEAIEKEACEILGVRELRDYFRKPGNGGFWMDHVKRYSKSRRKAPIYWYLRSAKGNYGLWLYYHRLDKDILFKALLNYVEPKLSLVNSHLSEIRVQVQQARDGGQVTKDTRKLEKEAEQLEIFLSELHDFKDKLRKAADLHLTPDLNDGVVLNIAPLWELVPWKEAKKYWEALTEGKYEWSSIGKQLRENGLVKG